VTLAGAPCSKPHCDIDAAAHEVAIALVDHVAEVNANPELDAALLRQSRVALDEAVLHFDCAADRVETLRNSMMLPSPVRVTTRP
jgi:hypothetical protein